MPLPAFLTKERSIYYRLVFGFCSAVFFGLCLLHIARQNWDLAAFLGGVGMLCVLAATLLNERQLQVLTTALIVANVAGAVVVLVFGVKVQ